MEHRFGVAGSLEAVAQRDQLLPQVLEIIGLAVVGDHIPSIGAVHGLAAVGQVDDGQAAVGDGAVFIHKVALAVGAAVADGVPHGVERLLIIVS